MTVLSIFDNAASMHMRNTLLSNCVSCFANDYFRENSNNVGSNVAAKFVIFQNLIAITVMTSIEVKDS